MGIVLSVSRFGSVVSLNVLSTIYDWLYDINEERDEIKSEETVLGKTMALAAFFTIASFLAAFILSWMDKFFYKPEVDTS